MTDAERLEVVRSIVIASMWGYGGVGQSVIEQLDKRLPAEPSWGSLQAEHSKAMRREHMGVLDDEEQLRWLMSRGYWLVNYDDDGCSLFNPPPMNGLYMYVSERLAEQFRAAPPPRVTSRAFALGFEAYEHIFGVEDVP